MTLKPQTFSSLNIQYRLKNVKHKPTAILWILFFMRLQQKMFQ